MLLLRRRSKLQSSIFFYVGVILYRLEQINEFRIHLNWKSHYRSYLLISFVLMKISTFCSIFLCFLLNNLLRPLHHSYLHLYQSSHFLPHRNHLPQALLCTFISLIVSLNPSIFSINIMNKFLQILNNPYIWIFDKIIYLISTYPIWVNASYFCLHTWHLSIF